MDRRLTLWRACFGVLASACLVACQGGGANPPPFFTGTFVPPGQLNAAPSSLTFSGVGGTYAQTVTVTTTVAVSTVQVTSTCGTGATAIVSFAAPSGSGTTFTDVVTPVNGGTCTATISSTQGGSATVTFTVNTGSVTVSSRHERQSP
jgi:hypothetical protein